MKKKNLSKLSGGIAVAGAVALAGVYFFTREMMGTALNRDESGFLKSSNHHRKLTPAKEAFNEARREAMEVMDGLPMEEVTLTATDGTRLVGHWYPCPEEKRVILAMHGWRSSWKKDFCLITPFLHKNGCSILFAEQRGQNGSGGEYMSFGLMERYDCLTWARWLAEKCPQRPIYLSGVSMGATTVLMASNLDLPKQVHGIIADCGYTSPYEIWKHVVNGKIHLPYVLRGKMSDTMFLRRVKAGSSRYSAQDALAMTKLPVLFVHCTEDHFVPVKMTYQNYKSCAGPKRLLIVPGGDHSMSYFLEKDKYEKELKSLWADYDE